jgi:hypothetical protein
MAGKHRNHYANRTCVVLVLMFGVCPRLSASDEQIQASPRVRGGTPSISQTISLAAERSPTFQSLVATVEGTDGIVYVHRGQCGRQVLSCLLLVVTKAGDYRILHIKVDERRREDALMAIATRRTTSMMGGRLGATDTALRHKRPSRPSCKSTRNCERGGEGSGPGECLPETTESLDSSGPRIGQFEVLNGQISSARASQRRRLATPVEEP